MEIKEITALFIRNSDGTISVKIKPSEEQYSDVEIYMLYKYLHQLLTDMKFDWSIEGTFETIVQREEK